MSTTYDLAVNWNTSGATVYAVLRDLLTAKVWNNQSLGLVAYTDADWSHYAVPLTDLGGGVYGASMPGVTAGTNLGIQYRVQYGASPAITDDVAGKETKSWFGLPPTDLGPGVISDSWITLAQVQALKGWPLSLSDAQSAGIINATIRYITHWLKRPVFKAYYKKWVDSYGTNFIWLEERPLVQVLRVAAAREMAGSIIFRGTRPEGFTQARFSIRQDLGFIYLTYTYMGTKVDTAMPISDYLTIADFKAGVLQQVIGRWNFLMGGPMDYFPMTEVRPCEFQNCLAFPSPIYIPGFEVADFITDYDSGFIYRKDVENFPRDRRCVLVEYWAGYERDEVPPEFIQAALDATIYWARWSLQDQTLRSHRLGDEAWVRDVAPEFHSGLQALLYAKLGMYRSPTI